MDPGELFLSDLIAGQHEQHATDQNHDDGHNDPVDDDASVFTTEMIADAEESDASGNLSA